MVHSYMYYESSVFVAAIGRGLGIMGHLGLKGLAPQTGTTIFFTI